MVGGPELPAAPRPQPLPLPIVTPARPAPAAPAKPRPAFGASVPTRLRVSGRGVVAVKLTCTGAGTCRDELRLTTRAKKPVVLGRKAFAVAAGRSATVRITLSKKIRRRLAGRTSAARLVLVGAKRTRNVTVRG